MKRVHRLVNTGDREVVDGDLSSHFGEIPHAGPMKSVARRVSDGRMPGLVKAWLEMPTEEDDGEGGKRRTNRARRERKGTPQGAPVPPCLGNLYMRRFILGWKMLGHARRFSSEIVNHPDDFRLLGKAQAAEMLPAVRQIMERLKLRLNEGKTGCLRCPEEALEFLGYRVGRNHRPRGGTYIGTRPSRASVKGICRKVSERTAAKYGGTTTEDMVGHLNRILSGWANYWHLGQVSPAYAAIDAHTGRRLRQWLCGSTGQRKGGMRATRTKGCGKPTACRPLRRRPGAFRGGGHDPSESRMRENRTSGLTGGDGETWPRWGMGHRYRAKAAGQQPLPAPTAGRVSPRLYDSLLFLTTESIAATWPDVNMLIRRNPGLQPRGCTLELKGRCIKRA